MSRMSFFGLVLALSAAAVPTALAYRFALEYRRRAGLPHRRPVEGDPAALGLDCEPVFVESDGRRLPGWFVPARSMEELAAVEAQHRTPGASIDPAASIEPGPRSPERRPAIAIVHGWESNRARALAQARFLHAAGFHCLTFDVRGHGDNLPESLPISAAEFGADAAAAARYLLTRPDVSAVGVLGHSMGGAAALIAAAQVPEIRAVVTLSAPSDPVRLTRAAFRLADLHLAGPIELPLAWLTARVFLAPRRRTLRDASASAAAARYRGPLLLVHGAEDRAIPVEQLDRLAAATRNARRTSPRQARRAEAASVRDGRGTAPVETLVLPGVGHRWLYEVPLYRRTVAAFLARHLGGPISPERAGDLAASCDVRRPDDPVQGFGALGDLAGSAGTS